MQRVTHAATALLLGLVLSLAVAGPAAAQRELPTGAARIVEKVQTRIFISQAMLGFKVEAILANQPAPGGE
jgi:hypothetical protein